MVKGLTGKAQDSRSRTDGLRLQMLGFNVHHEMGEILRWVSGNGFKVYGLGFVV